MQKKILLLLIVVVIFGSCTVKQKLSQKYVGVGVERLYKDFGASVKTTEIENKNKIIVFEKETFVKETIIGTGRTTLDPRISPAYTKVEVYRFEVDPQGIVVWTDYEKKIE